MSPLVLLKFYWSPDVESRECICSFCAHRIKSEPATRLFDERAKYEMRFHHDCFQVLAELKDKKFRFRVPYVLIPGDYKEWPPRTLAKLKEINDTIFSLEGRP